MPVSEWFYEQTKVTRRALVECSAGQRQSNVASSVALDPTAHSHRNCAQNDEIVEFFTSLCWLPEHRTEIFYRSRQRSGLWWSLFITPVDTDSIQYNTIQCKKIKDKESKNKTTKQDNRH